MTAPDQEYGKRTSQEQSQRILPIGPQAVASPAPAPPSGPAQPAAGGGVLPTGGLPGDPGPAHTWAPGSPGAPFTTGMPSGPGPGPEALQGVAANWHAMTQTAPSEQNTLRSVLTHLATQPGASSLMKSLAGNT